MRWRPTTGPSVTSSNSAELPDEAQERTKHRHHQDIYAAWRRAVERICRRVDLHASVLHYILGVRAVHTHTHTQIVIFKGRYAGKWHYICPFTLSQAQFMALYTLVTNLAVSSTVHEQDLALMSVSSC